MPFRPVPHPKVADSVLAEFESLLLHGLLRPGDKLPPERSLAETLGVSRSTLREVLDTLEARGLIARRQGSGAVVSELIASSLVDPLGALIAGRPGTLRDYLAFRRLIEREAAALAARLSTEADRRRIGAILDAMRSAHAARDAGQAARLDVEFHLAIVEAAGNAVTSQVMRALNRSMVQAMGALRAKIYARPGFSEEIMAQHAAIADAVAAGSAEAAAAASDAHLDYVEAELAAAEATAEREALADRRLSRSDGAGLSC